MHRVPGDNLPIVLSAIGVGLIIISGWLGGELVYVRGVAASSHPIKASDQPPLMSTLPMSIVA